MGKVIVLSRYFENSDANLEMHYSEVLKNIAPATIKFKAGRISMAKWNWTFKAECTYEDFIAIFNKYSLADSINVAEFIQDLDNIIHKNKGGTA